MYGVRPLLVVTWFFTSANVWKHCDANRALYLYERIVYIATTSRYYYNNVLNIHSLSGQMETGIIKMIKIITTRSAHIPISRIPLRERQSTLNCCREIKTLQSHLIVAIGWNICRSAFLFLYLFLSGVGKHIIFKILDLF